MRNGDQASSAAAKSNFFEASKVIQDKPTEGATCERSCSHGIVFQQKHKLTFISVGVRPCAHVREKQCKAAKMEAHLVEASYALSRIRNRDNLAKAAVPVRSFKMRRTGEGMQMHALSRMRRRSLRL